MKLFKSASKKRVFSLIMALCLFCMSTTTAFASTPLDQSVSAVSENTLDNNQDCTQDISSNLSTDFTTYSGAVDSFIISRSGTVKFFDGAVITVNNVRSLSTLKLTISGNPNAEYRITFTNSTTPKYIKANGSSCSVFTFVGGTIGITISLYNGQNTWITASVSN